MKKLLIYCTLLLSPFFLFAQNKPSEEIKTLLKKTVFFNTPDPLDITLVSDFKTIKGKRQKNVFQPAFATVNLPGHPPVTEEIQLAARGEFRRTNCRMPSMMLNFKSPKAPTLGALKKLKLVCGCGSSDYDEELLLREYLVYKMYNMLTDMSFKVRLIKVTYKDDQEKMKAYSQFGFLIEDVDDLAKRNKCKEFKKLVPNAARTDKQQMGLVSLFQYMIGNTDWSLPNSHNIKFIQLANDSVSFPYVIPYDFDYCGMVNAPYAIPQAEFGIERVTDRYYRGIAMAKEELNPIVQLFKEKREFIEALISNFTLLKDKTRKEMLYFLGEFYKDLEDKRMLTNVFEKALDHR